MWRSSRTRERGNVDEAGEGWICFLFFLLMISHRVGICTENSFLKVKY